jgi:hypothetical protein
MLRMRQPLCPLSYPVKGAPTRSRTSRLRHRRPVLSPAELWTHDIEDLEAPTGIEPVASWVETRCSIRMSYGAEKGIHGLAWTGSNRSTSPMSRGRSAAELQANGCRAGIRTWTTRVNSSTRYRLTPRGSGGEKGIRTPASVAKRRPTWVATRPLEPDLGTSPCGGGRASRTLMPARRRLPFSRRWPLPMGDPSISCAMPGWSRRDRTADFLDVGEALYR